MGTSRSQHYLCPVCSLFCVKSTHQCDGKYRFFPTPTIPRTWKRTGG